MSESTSDTARESGKSSLRPSWGRLPRSGSYDVGCSNDLGSARVVVLSLRQEVPARPLASVAVALALWRWGLQPGGWKLNCTGLAFLLGPGVLLTCWENCDAIHEGQLRRL